MSTSTTPKPKPQAEADANDTGVSLKDPASLVKAYFRFRTTVLGKQEAIALRVVERAPKSIKVPKLDRSQLFKLPNRGQKVSASS